MAKEIEYPTQEWLDSWVDKYLDKHPDEKVEDFSALEEQAKMEWWDKQIDKGNPTPFDATAEELKNVKDMNRKSKDRKSVPNYSLAGKPKRERKPNEEKRNAMDALFSFVNQTFTGAILSNPEREITFKIGENDYSLTLTCHRKKKGE